MAITQPAKQVGRPNPCEWLSERELSQGSLTCNSVLVLVGTTLTSSRAKKRDDPNEFYKLRTGRSEFRYYELGRRIPFRSGRESSPLSRFVGAPSIGLPMKVDRKRGVRIYCNTQVYGLGGFLKLNGPSVPSIGVDSAINYELPWTSNFHEKRGRNGNPRQLRACGTK